MKFFVFNLAFLLNFNYNALNYNENKSKGEHNYDNQQISSCMD